MQTFLFTIDRISAFVGKAFAWSILLLTFAISYEVFSRYVLGVPTDWAFDTSYILYGVLFMMAGAYTLSRNGHVRGDVLYGFLSPRKQATIDLILYIVFFIPGIAALIYAGYDFAHMSWQLKEHSSLTPNGPPLYHFKTIIPIAGFFVLLQGVAEIVRCVLCLRYGKWPQRLHDVEEVDVDELRRIVAAAPK